MKNSGIAGKNVGCIGCGTMGGAVVRAIASSHLDVQLFVSSGHYSRAESFVESLSDLSSGGRARSCESNLALAKSCDIIFIAVKPAFVKTVIEEIRPAFSGHKLLISMAAGVTLSSLREYASAGGNPACPRLLRMMPNLPAVYGESMTALCYDKDAGEDEIGMAVSLLETAGKVELVSEKMMDGVTAVSGSGPAYAFMFIEALADAAVKFGIPRKQAYVYAAQTLKGAAVMALEDSRSISELKDAVCSPAGTTIEAVAALEKGGFRGLVIDAASAAYARSVELGRKS
ncbi:MAG: pyrroline-5-carboxylate reductase [Treponema sp.]|nr:pyrroline-5-carboxylate reductase [Treponema sp.]